MHCIHHTDAAFVYLLIAFYADSLSQLIETFSHLLGLLALYLGWSSRTQFEETWATLLGVLVTQPITMDQEEETQQEVCTHRTS